MFTNTFKEALKRNGVVSITTWSVGTVHVTNTWNNYLQICEGNKILIPAAWLHRTEKTYNLIKTLYLP